MAHVDVPRKILVAVDFGTTYSGLAWAQTGNARVQTLIQQWPDSNMGYEGMTSDKVPTILKYDNNLNSYRWGFQIRDNEERLEWFKLDLDPSQDRGETGLSRTFPRPPALHRPNNVSSQRLVTDYLKALKNHAEYMLKERLPDVILRATPREYILTIPAVWSDLAKQKTKICAEAAGMGSGDRLHVISEPEAAAICVLEDLDPHFINVGDTFLVCDAGGGTVDLITYTIEALKQGSRPLQVREAAPGSGHLCGSTYLNRIFAKYMTDRFSDRFGWSNELLKEAIKVFDTETKRRFQGRAGDAYYDIPVNGLTDDPAAGISRNSLRLPRHIVREIFKPVIDEIKTLVLNQMRTSTSPVKFIVLVGGFGSNTYLRSELRAVVGDTVHLWCAANSWTAVVCGALKKGLTEVAPSLGTVRVTSRAARKHYGTSAFVRYRTGEHRADKPRFPDGLSGGERIPVMKWLVRKGESVDDAGAQPFEYFWDQPCDSGHPTQITMPLFCCELENAPDYPDDEGIVQLALLKADLSTIPETRLNKRPGANGRWYYKINYEIQMICGSANTTFLLVFDNRPIGRVEAEFV